MRKNVLSYEKGHPNPLFYRKEWLSLNGAWDFVYDDANLGLQEGWSRETPKSELKIQVPYAIETPRSGVADGKEHKILWYFKHFNNPQWSEKTMLHFERCDYVFDGWVNGHYLGKHIGGYDAFRFDITDFLNDGDNVLSVRVYDDKDPTHLRGKQTWKEKPFDCFYGTTSGLYGDVWLERVPRASFQGYDVRGSYEDKSLYFRLLFTPEAVGSQAIINVSYRGKPVVATSFMVSSIFMEESLAIPKPDFHAWSPAFPCLYDIEMVLARNGQQSDRVLSYTGINEIRQKKSYITLNGKKRYLKFLLYQGYNPKGGLTENEDEALQDIRLMKDMGFNGARIHEKVESEVFYYLADREGLLTNLELPSAQTFSEFEKDEISSEWGRLVTDHVGHPSLIAYVAINESWGVQGVNNDPDLQAFTRSLYDMANRIDWTRPALSNEGWEHTCSDILALHHYAENGAELLKQYSDIKTALKNNGNFEIFVKRRAFAGDYHYSGQPIVMSEFFGACFEKDNKKGWGYGDAIKSVSAYLRRYRSLLKAIKKLGCCGYCATQFADTYQEKNGFVDEKRVPKASLEALKRANKSF